MKQRRKPGRTVLKELSLGVEEIIDEFGWLGITESDGNNAEGVYAESTDGGGEQNQPSPGDESHDEADDEYSEYQPDRVFEREDIEIGIDRLVSRLIKKKLISKQKLGRRPTLSEVFSAFFGESHPIVELVYSFEEHIKGYFGIVEYDEMSNAFSDILKAKALLEKDLDAAGA